LRYWFYLAALALKLLHEGEHVLESSTATTVQAARERAFAKPILLGYSRLVCGRTWTQCRIDSLTNFGPLSERM